MMKQNKPLQGTQNKKLVDIAKLHTPSGYAALIGHSRANVYLLINSGNITSDNIFYCDKQQLILEDGREDERRKKNDRTI